MSDVKQSILLNYNVCSSCGRWRALHGLLGSLVSSDAKVDLKLKLGFQLVNTWACVPMIQ